MARKVGAAAQLDRPILTVACPECDVTWRGTTADPCWSCGKTGIATAAPAFRVKVTTTPDD